MRPVWGVGRQAFAAGPRPGGGRSGNLLPFAWVARAVQAGGGRVPFSSSAFSFVPIGRLRAYPNRCSVGPRSSEDEPGKEAEAGDAAESIADAGRRRPAKPQPTEARMTYWDRL